MPITNPTFQHSDEDWTQITQPRLRKRVQNRVSQRKHRSKIRQQRANSVDTERAVSTSEGTRKHSNHHGSVSSSSSSGHGGQQQGQQVFDLSKQVFAEPDQMQPWSGSNDFAYSEFENPPHVESHQPWLDYPPPSYPTTSTYPVGSPFIPITPTHASNSYDPTHSTDPIGRSFPYVSSPEPPVANARTSTMKMAHNNIPQPSSYVPITSVPPSQYLSSTGLADFSLDERAYERSSNMWDHPAAHDTISNDALGPTNLNHSGQPAFNNIGYYGTHSLSRNNSTSNTKSVPGPESSSGFYSGYDYDLLSPTSCLGMEPRGSGIDSKYYYGSGTNYYSGSAPKERKRSRYPSR